MNSPSDRKKERKRESVCVYMCGYAEESTVECRELSHPRLETASNTSAREEEKKKSEIVHVGVKY